MKKILTKKNLLILFGGIVLTMLLLLPRTFSGSCPLTTTYDPSLPANCPFFVDKDSDQICDLLQKKDAFPSQDEFSFSFFPEFIVFLLLLLSAIFLNLKKPKNLATFRFALLVFSLIYFGFLLSQALCPIATLQMVFVSREKIVLTFFIFLVFLLPLLTTLLFGSIFCNYLCPIGAVQELIFRISRKFSKILPLARFPKILLSLPYIILFLVALGSAHFSFTVFCKLDPFGALFGCNPAGWKRPFLITFLVTSLFIYRPFCQFLCPLGAIFKFLEKFRILKPKTNS